jgi:hypothetical protein
MDTQQAGDLASQQLTRERIHREVERAFEVAVRKAINRSTSDQRAESGPAAHRVPGHHMNHAPRGTVRRSAEGALLVRQFGGDNGGWKLVPPQSEHCALFPDRAIDPAWLEWPIIWCPDATFHEPDNIRRARGTSTNLLARLRFCATATAPAR